MEYFTPAGPGKAEFTEKRSRFIGHIFRASSEDEAMSLISRVKSEYHDARHNCWCFAIREGGFLRYSDDGEPQGTAGRPMLEMLKKRGIDDVCCVVTRYFGGILLGTGGLARAYTAAAAAALENAGIETMRLYRCVEIVCPYALFERVRAETVKYGGAVEDADYGINVTVHAVFPEEGAALFTKGIYDATSGTVKACVKGEKFAAVP